MDRIVARQMTRRISLIRDISKSSACEFNRLLHLYFAVFLLAGDYQLGLKFSAFSNPILAQRAHWCDERNQTIIFDAYKVG